jgi:hypothetical protein
VLRALIRRATSSLTLPDVLWARVPGSNAAGCLASWVTRIVLGDAAALAVDLSSKAAAVTASTVVSSSTARRQRAVGGTLMCECVCGTAGINVAGSFAGMAAAFATSFLVRQTGSVLISVGSILAGRLRTPPPQDGFSGQQWHEVRCVAARGMRSSRARGSPVVWLCVFMCL